MRKILIASVALGGLLIAGSAAGAPTSTEKGAAVGAGTGAVVAGPVGAVVGKTAAKSGSTAMRHHRHHKHHKAATATAPAPQ
jgi:osmotically inducible lipoprotein OsmB